MRAPASEEEVRLEFFAAACSVPAATVPLRRIVLFVFGIERTCVLCRTYGISSLARASVGVTNQSNMAFGRVRK